MNVGLGRPGLEPHERVREVVAGPVELGREIVAFGLALAAQLGGLFLVLVHVVRDRPQVVEKLAVDRPALVGVPQIAADHLGAEDLDGVFERELVGAVHDVAESLVGGCSLVGGRGRRGEPALVDAAAVGAQRVEVLACQLESAARHQERTRHPGRSQPQDPFTTFESRAHPRGQVFIAHRSSSLHLSQAHETGHGRKRKPVKVNWGEKAPLSCPAAPARDSNVLRLLPFRRKPLLKAALPFHFNLPPKWVFAIVPGRRIG